MEDLGKHASAVDVVKTVKQFSSNPKRRWDDATCTARMYALFENLNRKHAANKPSKRCGYPKLFIVSTARIKANDKTHLA